MYKALSLAVLLLAVFAFTSDSKSVGAVPASPISPVIVARGKLVNQTEPYSATIYTPAQDGVYRLSAYATITVASAGSGSDWNYGYNWTDVTGQPQQVFFALNCDDTALAQCVLGGQSFIIGIGGIVTTIQANKGTPIVHSMSGTPDGSAYSLYYVLERIE
jgi:hypothetical protein